MITCVMAAVTPEAIERRYRAELQRRKDRRRDTKGFSARETKARRKRHNSPASKEKRAQARAKAREIADALPFVGCDGEGLKDATGRSRYALFRMGDRELYAGDRRLETPELLRFITDHPDPKAILVGFFFGYDADNILMDVPPDRLADLLRLDRSTQNGAKNPFARNAFWTWLRFPGHPTYGVQYIPRQYLRVCVGASFVDPATGERRTLAAQGSTRTIYDTQGFFQSSFLVALNRWEIGREHWESIAAGKAGRAGFSTITPEIRRYNAIECELLADMMSAFRSACLGAGIRPRTWNGAGKLAAALMRDHGVAKAAEVEALVPAGLITFAHEAYYGGRFEVTRCGPLNRSVHEFDINSAYPAAMRELPCLDHGHWRKASGAELVSSRGLFVARVQFHHPLGTFLCGLPVRSHDNGSLSWPREGRGTYWSAEIRSAQALGADIKVYDGWLYERRCKCRSHQWIEALYEHRRALGKDARGQPLKLGYNSVYGKYAQRIGKPPFANPIFAGLITALTRAKLNRAALAAGPENVIMLATDALFTIGRKPGLDVGEGLGQWEYKRHPDLFIVHPGFYWPPRPTDKKWSLKSRGISPRFFEDKIELFTRAWDHFYRTRRTNLSLRAPIVPIEIETFVGHRLAMHQNRNHPERAAEKACQWVNRTINLRFECDSPNKRHNQRWEGRHLILGTRAGDDRIASAHYEAGKLLKTSNPLQEMRLLVDSMPDPVELGPPFVED